MVTNMITLRTTTTMLLCAAAALQSLVTSRASETSMKTVLAASGAGANGTVDDGCPATCGNLSFAYPFGIGQECSRGPDFRLTCNETHRPPKLFLRDGTTEVLTSINLESDEIWVSDWHAIPMRSGVRVYNFSLETPGRSFSYPFDTLMVTGCDLDVYWFNKVASMTRLACSTWCSGEETTEMAARQDCRGMGCCLVLLLDMQIVVLNFVRRKSSIGASTSSNRTSLLWDRITVAGGPDGVSRLAWSIVDQPNCHSAMKDRTDYACISNHSNCYDYDAFRATEAGYLCYCQAGYSGNPYILDGCTTTDKGYNPKPSRTDCTRQCGNITVPFPFGLEEGCFAREEFHLVCTNATSSAVLKLLFYQVIHLNVNQGILNYTEEMGGRSVALNTGRDLFLADHGLTSLGWVVANLTCSEAKGNTSRYACVSINSSCVELNYVGYRCKCLDGFQGNPYVQNGCRERSGLQILMSAIFNETFVRAESAIMWKEVSCVLNALATLSMIPRKTSVLEQKQQVLLTGIIIGLSGGFSILLTSFVAVHLFRSWKRNAQKQLRSNYFRQNQGLLLEQLISPDKTNIFSLEELEKATNNFDPTRVIGHGGHGMVYKGILSDQRVVAIKKSILIEHREIKQFINEVAILSEINHRNIVKLFGCCLESEVPLLVYDYIPNGSLSQVLHPDPRIDVPLSWNDYIRIAAEAAGALSYLHSEASISIFHRDVKSSNILLDGNYTAKVSDFGASRLVPVDQTHIVTNVQGTYGYLDPEYFYTRQLNEKSDVYSFGVVLLELLLRKKPVFTSNSGLVQNLSNYFRQALTEKEITDIVDSQVIEEATKEEIHSVASLAEMCLRLRGEERPTMKQVEMELQILRKKRVNSCQPSTTELGERVNYLPVQHTQQCYSLERDFMESATLPR